MEIYEEKDYCVCQTVVRLTSFDRFCIAQATADLEDQCDAMSEERIIVPKKVYDKVLTLFTKLAGKDLMKNAHYDVFAPEPEDLTPRPADQQ